MCGIVGYWPITPSSEAAPAFARLFEESSVRGLHAFGLVTLQRDRLKVWRSFEHHDIVGRFNHTFPMLAHARYSTSGDWRTLDNNQPLVVNKTALAFNGVLHMGTKSEFEAAFDVRCTSDNDGEVFLRRLVAGEMAEAFLRRTSGSFAGVWFQDGRLLAGRNDLAPLLRYVSGFGRFSDDGDTLNGAYGYRWRKALDEDQLLVIAERLAANRDDRRCVLQMWQGEYDLGGELKDIPCNLMATFQRDADGALDLTVFCRSNDIIWGAYGANAVHFGFLLEYMAVLIGCPVGTYRQVSVNWHAYLDTLATVAELPAQAFTGLYAVPEPIADPYASGVARALPLLADGFTNETLTERQNDLDTLIREVLMNADTGFSLPRLRNDDEPFFDMAYAVLKAHHWWRTLAAPERFDRSLTILATADQTVDWVQASTQWVTRRYQTWEAKMANTKAAV